MNKSADQEWWPRLAPVIRALQEAKAGGPQFKALFEQLSKALSQN